MVWKFGVGKIHTAFSQGSALGIQSGVAAALCHRSPWPAARLALAPCQTAGTWFFHPMKELIEELERWGADVIFGRAKGFRAALMRFAMRALSGVFRIIVQIRLR